MIDYILKNKFMKLIKIAKIKDGILNALEGTQVADLRMAKEEKSITKEEFFSKIKIEYDKNTFNLILDELEKDGYIRFWNHGNDEWVYALDKKGELELMKGGFKVTLFWPLILTVSGAMLAWIIQLFIKMFID